MNIELIIKKAKKSEYVILSEPGLKNLLSVAKVIQEKDTHISGMIRLLQLDGKLLIQEKSNKGEFLVRLMKTKKEADDFIKERLDTYNRMWDGCGCKVDYYN